MAKSSLIGALRVTLGMDTAEFERRSSAAQNKVARLGKSFANFAKIATAASTAVGAALGVAVKRTIDQADSLTKLSQSLGVPIDQLSRLQHVADLSGVSIESLGTSFRRLSVNMNEVSMGAGQTAARAFAQIGVAVKNADGTLRTSQQVMGDVADRFARMEDGAQKTAIAVALFGRAGADLIPMLNGGSQAINQMMSEADQLGLTLDLKTGQAAERFNDNMTRIRRAFDGIVLRIATALLPHLERLAQAMVDFVKDGDKVQKTADLIVRGLQYIAATANLVVGGLRNIGAAFRFLGNIASDPFNMESLSAANQQYLSELEQIRGDYEATKKLIWGDDGAGKPNISSRWVEDFSAPAAVIPQRLQQYVKQPLEEVTVAADNFGTSGVRAAERLGAALPDLVPAFDHVSTSMDGIAQTLQGAFSGMFDSIMDGTFKTGDAFESLARTILKSFNNRAISQIFSGLFSAGGGGGFGGLIGNMFGGFRPGSTGMAGLPMYAQGTPYVPETGPAILHKGEAVIPAKYNTGMGGGGDMVVNIINNGNNEVRTQQRQTAGGKQLDVIIDEIVADKINTPGSASRRALSLNGGIQPQLARR